ncbi:hypothetical protein A3842_30430 [Paenibacillus sp. P3E]|nr:hypothetical protein A3842_30430 [Paenibacillus sp. P3E]
MSKLPESRQNVDPIPMEDLNLEKEEEKDKEAPKTVPRVTKSTLPDSKEVHYPRSCHFIITEGSSC